MKINDLLKGKEEPACEQDEGQGQVEDTRLSGHHNPPVTVKLIPPREGLPFLPQGPLLVWGLHRSGAASAYLAVLALSHGLGDSEMHERVRYCTSTHPQTFRPQGDPKVRLSTEEIGQR